MTGEPIPSPPLQKSTHWTGEPVCIVCARHKSEHPELGFTRLPAVRVLGRRKPYIDDECLKDIGL